MRIHTDPARRPPSPQSTYPGSQKRPALITGQTTTMVTTAIIIAPPACTVTVCQVLGRLS